MPDTPAITSRKDFLRFFQRRIGRVLSQWNDADVKSKRKFAYLDASTCLAWSGTRCQACYLACPKRDEAICVANEKPVVIASSCDGCGKCVPVCEAVNSPAAMKLVYDRASSV